jgi:hypothetical protein
MEVREDLSDTLSISVHIFSAVHFLDIPHLQSVQRVEGTDAR